MEKKAKRDKAIKDIVDRAELEAVIKRCDVCHVAMVDGDRPYVLGFNFGYEDGAIYLHTSKEGKKIDVLKRNPNVCVSFDTDYRLFSRHEHVACSWRMSYRSVLVTGTVEFIDSYEEKLKALKVFMKNYSDNNFEFNKPSVDNVLILKVTNTQLTGRSFEY